MSRFLMLICLALGLVVTGCGGDTKKEGDKGSSKKEEKSSSDKGSAAKDEGKEGDEAKAEEKADAKADDKADEKAEDKGASVEKAGDGQLVSLKLPNMT